MPRFRIPYSAEALFVGPSPATGYNFLDYNSNLNNNYTSGVNNINLITHLNRVQNVSFDIITPKTDVKSFGKYGSVRSYAAETPTVSLNFEYLQVGVRNEDKIGLYVNFPKQTYQGLSDPVFPDNYNVFLLSGFYTSSTNRSNRAYNWPFDYRDSRNFFLSVAKNEGQDYNARTSGANVQDSNVFAFGNCYLNSYKARGAVGDFPRVSCSYTAENCVMYTSGSGISSPAVDPQTFSQYSSVKCVLPNGYDSGIVSALLPGDISINVTSFPIITGVSALKGTGNAMTANQSIYNLGISYTGIEIENYDLTLEMPRRAVKSLTHILPINRKMIFPVKCNLNLQIVVHDYVSGSVENIFKSEENYDVSVIIVNPYSASLQGTAIRYDLKKAVLNSLSYQTSIGANKILNLAFSTELSPDDFSRGLFISGLYNSNQLLSSIGGLQQENSFYILQEDGNRILIEDNNFQI